MIAWLERNLGSFAIPHLIRGIVILKAIAFAMIALQPGFVHLMVLAPEQVWQGQIWRLFTFVLIPPTRSFIFILCMLSLLWSFGEGLEARWGRMRLNVYFFMGWLGTLLGAFFLDVVNPTGAFIYTSLLFAFATYYPNYQILLFFVIPIAIRWIAWFTAIGVGYFFILGDWSIKVAILIAMGNYLLFFIPHFIRQTWHSRQVVKRREKFESNLMPESEIFHRCAVCGRTDVSHPEVHFRVGSDGVDYCSDHLPKKTK